jgi:hypothetical protein
MYAPMGLTSAQTIAKTRAACSHPMSVIVRIPLSEAFRAYHRVDEIAERRDGEQEPDREIGAHIRSQPIT